MTLQPSRRGFIWYEQFLRFDVVPGKVYGQSPAAMPWCPTPTGAIFKVA